MANSLLTALSNNPMVAGMAGSPSPGIGPTPPTPGKGKCQHGQDKKAKRNPNKPKRPASAYLMYQNVVCKEFAAKYPGLLYHKVLSKILDQWQQLSNKEKEVLPICSVTAVG